MRVQPLVRDVDLMMREDLGAKGKSALLAAFALEAITDAQQANRQILGVAPPYDVYVDGNEGAPLTSVKPDGVIRAEFHLFGEVLAWIATQLQTHSPVLTGRYAKSHELFADGVQTDNPNNPPPADEYVFTNIQPYARKIERGKSSQAPDGVYQAVATLAQRRFGNIAKITFSYRTAIGGGLVGGKAGDRSDVRNPAIIVKLR
jgi:hypothetical protein